MKFFFFQFLLVSGLTGTVDSYRQIKGSLFKILKQTLPQGLTLWHPYFHFSKKSGFQLKIEEKLPLIFTKNQVCQLKKDYDWETFPKRAASRVYGRRKLILPYVMRKWTPFFNKKKTKLFRVERNILFQQNKINSAIFIQHYSIFLFLCIVQ